MAEGGLADSFLGPLVQGFGLNFGLLLAIGAQAVFVLQQGLGRRHVAPVVLTCCLCDLALISAAVFGMGALVAPEGLAGTALRWLGIAFLLAYGASALARAWRPVPSGSAASLAGPRTALAAVFATLAVTLLNPHVHFDIFVLIGGAATAHAEAARLAFLLGAVSASVLWFILLGFGAARLAPVLARPTAHRALGVGVAAVMFGSAGALAL